MGSRKESLKKSLGISEYPWSSDEEDNNNTSQPVQELRRPSDEPRTSTADMPGTSGGNSGNTSTPLDDSWWRGVSASMQADGPASGGVQPTTEPASPGSMRRAQAKMDRALFWSIINNTPRSANVQPTRLRPPRICDLPLPCVQRPGNTPREVREPRRHERPHSSGSADIQRILAFKKITRNLHNLTQCKQGSNLQMTSRRVGLGGMSGSSRSPLFTPSVPAAVANRVRNYCCNNSQPGRSTLPAGYTRSANPPDVLPVGVAQPSTSGRNRSGSRTSPASSAVDVGTSPPPPDRGLVMYDQYVNVDQSDDDVEAVPDAAPVVEQTDDNNAEEENNETAPHNEPAGAISLEEEVMEVDAPDEADNAPAADVETDAIEPNVNNEGNAVATNSEENADASQQSPFHGVKRKRDSNPNDDNAETYSVQEFNQSLLRLLECPVCLEWMEPPISQCRRGHLVCSRCRTRLASCPVCRTTFSSVRNRAMEGVAEMLRYPCRHGCGREVRLRRRAPHEASCGARRYHCPAPPCARHPPLAHHELAHHFQCKHLPIVKIGRKHKFSMKVNSEQHDTWLIMAMDEFFHLRVDVDVRTWGVIVYVAYIGPKRRAKNYTYEVTVEGQHNSRSLKYARATHSDLESSTLNVSRQDCFHLTLDQALNFLRFKNRHCEPDKFLDFDVEIGKCHSVNGQESKDDSDS